MLPQQNEIVTELPEKLSFLLSESYRYKGARGGRGSAKSWSFARALLLIGAQKKTRILCARELQKSIKESVHQLLSDQIRLMGLESFYTILEKTITGKNGTSFGFIGLKHNTIEIKSYEGADIAWIEEAQAVSSKSWEILIPTIRKDGSEIWLTFNPELEDDPTYQRFCIKPPTDSNIITMNWQDNPWFPDVLAYEKDEMKERDPDAYLHVWEGHCREVLDGAIFAKELRQSKTDNRITDVPYDTTKPVHTFWDLGWNNLSGRTAIIMAQSINGTYRLIDYMEDAEHTINWYVAELQKKPYAWGIDYLPHDAKSTNIAAGGRTVEKIMKSLGRKTKVLKRTLSIGNDINAAKTIFPQIFIDRNKCADLLQCLNRYKYEIDEETGLRGKNPVADIYTHGSDAFRQFAVGVTEDKVAVKKKRIPQKHYTGGGSWLG